MDTCGQIERTEATGDFCFGLTRRQGKFKMICYSVKGTSLFPVVLHLSVVSWKSSPMILVVAIPEF